MLKKYLFGGMPLWLVFWFFGVMVSGLVATAWIKNIGFGIHGYGQYIAVMVALIYFGATNFAIMNSSGNYKGPEVFKFLSFILSLVLLIFSFGFFVTAFIAMWIFNLNLLP